MADNDEISRRAHEIWEREGRPEGQSERHWREAAASFSAPEVEPVKTVGAKKADKPAKADAEPEKKGEKKKAAGAAKGAAGKAETSKKKAAGKGAKKAG